MPTRPIGRYVTSLGPGKGKSSRSFPAWYSLLHPVLVFLVGNDKVSTRRLWRIKVDLQGLGTTGAQIVFSSVLQVTGNDGETNRKIMKMNTCL